jgi:hypothetical protein
LLASLIDDVCTLLREAALAEYHDSHHWNDTGCWVDTGYLLLAALMTKVVAENPIGEEYDAEWDVELLSGSDYTAPHVASIEHWEDTGLIDEEWMRDMYTRSWDNLMEWDDAVYLE